MCYKITVLQSTHQTNHIPLPRSCKWVCTRIYSVSDSIYNCFKNYYTYHWIYAHLFFFLAVRKRSNTGIQQKTLHTKRRKPGIRQTLTSVARLLFLKTETVLIRHEHLDRQLFRVKVFMQKKKTVTSVD